jgi:hypothetical protein
MGFITELKDKFDGDEEITLKVLCCNRGGNSLIFGDNFKDFDAVIPFTTDGVQWTYSIFSHESKEFDLSKVASFFRDKYGISGGGHKHAAGWVADHCIFDEPQYKKTKFKDYIVSKAE